MRIGTWNVQWASPGARGDEVRALVEGLTLDIFVGTEVTLAVLPRGGHVIDAGDDWGYSLPRADRRKVAMWSREPWRDVAVPDLAEMPGGRCAIGMTTTAEGPLTVVGVCVPWGGAHVASGRKDRRRWEEHQAFLVALREVLFQIDGPVVVAGDFNQRIPRGHQPSGMFDLLMETLCGLRIVTAGEHGPTALIDHVAHSVKLVGEVVEIIDNGGTKSRLSDHLGVVVRLEAP